MIVGWSLLVAVQRPRVFWPRPLVELKLKRRHEAARRGLAREPIPASPSSPTHRRAARPAASWATATSTASISAGSTQTRSRRATCPGDAVLRRAAGVGPVLRLRSCAVEDGRPAAVAAADPERSARRSRRSLTKARSADRARSQQRLERAARSATSTTRSSRQRLGSAAPGARTATEIAGPIARLAERARHGARSSEYARPAGRRLDDARRGERREYGHLQPTPTAPRRRCPSRDVVRAYPAQPASASAASSASTSRALGVPRRRAARGEHRGRRLPGDLRHGDDGHADERRRRAVRRARRALPARVREAGAARQRRAHRGEQPRRRALDRLRRLRPRLLRLPRRRQRSTSSSSRRTLPTPTFGTGGILWASLTLALLTLPVVIVATEEALAAVPRVDARRLATRSAPPSGRRSAASCCRRRPRHHDRPDPRDGARRRRGRAADARGRRQARARRCRSTATFPFVHLERKFMHLGFHIYDLGFQSPEHRGGEADGLHHHAPPDRSSWSLLNLGGDPRPRRGCGGKLRDGDVLMENRRWMETHAGPASPDARTTRRPEPRLGVRAPHGAEPATAAGRSSRSSTSTSATARSRRSTTSRIEHPAEAGHGVHRALGLRQVDAPALPQPHERPHRRRAHRGRHPASTATTSTRRGST